MEAGRSATAVPLGAAQQQALEAIVEHAPLGLAFWDRELRYRRVNEALAAINGRSAAEHLGRTPSELLGDALGGEVEAVLRDVLEHVRPAAQLEFSGETAAEPGKVRHWVASFHPAGEVEPAGVAGAVVEVTELRRVEAERTQLLKDALAARAHAEAAQIRAQDAQVAAERAGARTELLAEAGRRMAASMDYETTLQEVAEISVPAIADWCAIAIGDAGGRLRGVAAAHADPARAGQARELVARHPDPEDPAVAEALGLGDSLIVPLRAAGRVVGTLALAMDGSGRRFSPDDESLATALAARSALHVRNAQLYAERSHIAKTLQASLLPRMLPEIPGLEVAGRYLAAGDQNDVGGDFYDVFPAGEGVWAALIGDVTGKGPEAAALTSLVRHTLRAAGIRGSDPVENLHVANRAMLADTLSTRFCTVVYARICPSPGTALVTLATGGHPPPLVLRADGTLERVDVRGSLVGGLADPEFGTRDVRLRAGDALVLYTDGVTELRTRDPAYGERRLEDTLRGHAGRSAAEIAEAVQSSAVALQDGPPRDDIAVLAVRVAEGRS